MVDTEVEENVMCPEFSNQAFCVWLAEVGRRFPNEIDAAETDYAAASEVLVY